MELKDIIDKQLAMDEKHGFPVKFESLPKKYNQLNKDLVGLFGEIGEFSNVVKKINLKLDRGEAYDFDLAGGEALLKEELVDTFIYIIRISQIIGIDLEAETLGKIDFNERRYAKLRR